MSVIIARKNGHKDPHALQVKVSQTFDLIQTMKIITESSYTQLKLTKEKHLKTE
ncbi:MAG: hypothetical protein H7336_13960 [Bacteriovorax sp.]|nr:hypothetical protein [Bacteriovorax sp.]